MQFKALFVLLILVFIACMLSIVVFQLNHPLLTNAQLWAANPIPLLTNAQLWAANPIPYLTMLVIWIGYLLYLAYRYLKE